MDNQGLFSYPGIQSFESIEGSDISGISPSVFVAKIFPQDEVPQADGDLVFSYNGNTITIWDAHIDRADYEQGSGGKTVIVRFLDSRWKWQAGREITGRYNIKLPNNYVDPRHEKTPQELAKLCFDAMGETSIDVTQLPNDARPDIDWVSMPAAEALARLCDELGCRIVPQRSTRQWAIVVVGEGADLPDNGWPYNDHGLGIDPKETPDYIRIVTAPVNFQVCLELESIGKRIADSGWSLLKDLDYKPSQVEGNDSYGFGIDPWAQESISADRIRQPDGSEISPRELATQFIFRTFRINDNPGNAATGTDDKGNKTFRIFGGPFLDSSQQMVTRQQIIPQNQLVESYTDVYGQEHPRSALMFGEFTGPLFENGNCNPGTRLDYQTSNSLEPEDRGTFSIAIDPIETDKTIVTTSKRMMFYNVVDATLTTYKAAKMFLVCAINIRDADNWQPIRVEQYLKIGKGNDKTFCKTFVKNDIQPWTIAAYDEYGNNDANTPQRDNKPEVVTQCDYYLQSIAKTYETVASESKVYFGLFPIDLDGAISQVTYRIGKQGCDTVVSRGTEHNFNIPTYEQRRQREGRHGIWQAMQLQTEINERRFKLLGTNNT